MVFSFNIKKFFDRICFLLFFLINNNAFAQQISLAGVWRFAVDRDDVGIKEMWFNKKLDDVIKLPGTMAENRKGDDVTLQTKWTGSIYDSSFFFRPSLAKYRQPGNIKIPFWLTPVKHYIGAMIMEAKVGNGKLIISSADLVSDTTHRSAARQLFYSIQQYMLSDKFDPKDKVDMAVIRDIFISPSKEQWDSYTKATPDELKPVKK